VTALRKAAELTKAAREFAQSSYSYTGSEVCLWVGNLCDEIDRLSAALDAQPQQPLQGGFDNDELRAEWDRKLPGQEPKGQELTTFAIGVEVGFAHAQKLDRQDWSRVHHVLKKHNAHPGRTDDHLADVIDRALAAQPQQSVSEGHEACIKLRSLGYTWDALNEEWSQQPQQAAPAWVSVSDRMPASGVTVLACYKNQAGKLRRVRARWAAAKSSESSPESDFGEYDEAADRYYDPEGWYEQIDNAVDYTAMLIDSPVTHWMTMPAAPDAQPKQEEPTVVAHALPTKTVVARGAPVPGGSVLNYADVRDIWREHEPHMPHAWAALIGAAEAAVLEKLRGGA